ncbi:hypothetical protein EDC01DRAFT_782401 [Geopyxis carbonaria]|nr:hypothetical protein EDC01DRAFT_782401 [Geopyxis carbonaria]
MDPNIDSEACIEEHKLCAVCQALVQECPLYQGRVIIRENYDGTVSRHPKTAAADAPTIEYSLRPTQKYPHYPTFAGLARSVEQGCHLCALLYSSVRIDGAPAATDGDGLRLMVAFIYGIPPTGHRCELMLSVMRGDAEAYSSGISASAEGAISDDERLVIGEWVPSAAVDIKHPAQLSRSTKSAASFQLAREWIDECVNRHPECGRPVGAGTPVRPTRLVDVQPEDPKIVLTAGFESTPEYLTLSYCWGQGLAFKLLESNIGQLTTDGIPMGSLPGTLRDAVIATRRLGYRDAICIIQDSTSDWVRESATMGSIYRNSVCTIAALHGEDTQSGCFVARNPLEHRACLVRAATPAAPAVYIHSHGTLSTLDREWQRVGPNMSRPLQTRAWVFSERVLAPRSLYYGARVISWECATADCTESRPRGNPLWVANDAKSHTRLKAALTQELAQPDNTAFDAAKFWRAWCRIVDVYSSCRLTYGRDRLPALFGIVRTVAAATGRANAAGLWRDNILAELLWWVVTPVPGPRPADAEWRAPSWAWAAAGSGVSFLLAPGSVYVPEHSRTVPQAEVVSVEIVGAQANGAVGEGSRVALRCPLRRVQPNLVKGVRFKRDAEQAEVDEWMALLVRQVRAGAAGPGEAFGLLLTERAGGWRRVGAWNSDGSEAALQHGWDAARTVVLY